MAIAIGDKNSGSVNDFRGRRLPEPGKPVGYAALIEKYDLRVRLPKQLTAIGARHVKMSTEEWQVLTARHHPDHSLSGHLTFALKWEAVELGILLTLFNTVAEGEIEQIVSKTPTGAYALRLRLIYEWLTGRQLNLPGFCNGKPVPGVVSALQ